MSEGERERDRGERSKARKNGSIQDINIPTTGNYAVDHGNGSRKDNNGATSNGVIFSRSSDSESMRIGAMEKC